MHRRRSRYRPNSATGGGFALLLVGSGLCCANLGSATEQQNASVLRYADGAVGSGSRAWNQRVARSARWHLEAKPQTQRRDCSGLVEAILARAGAAVHGNSRSFFQQARGSDRVVRDPRPGDLAFFDRTYDANGNGRVDDLLTHVAVVVQVHADGSIEMVHRGSGRIQTLTMNLRRPAVHRDASRLVNDYLRAPGYGPRAGPRLAGQLFRAFARPPKG